MASTLTLIETDCTVTHNGRTFEAGGASVSPARLVAYVGKVREGGPANVRDLTDWHGNVIGEARLTSSWRTPRSFMASRMYQAYATVDGVTYTGRTCGEGMSYVGRPVRRA